MENLIPIIIQLISGAVGGNMAGKALENYSLGTLINSVVGILGGGLGGQLLGLLGIDAGSGGMDITDIVGSIASGGVGGSVLLVLIGIVKKKLRE